MTVSEMDGLTSLGPSMSLSGRTGNTVDFRRSNKRLRVAPLFGVSDSPAAVVKASFAAERQDARSGQVPEPFFRDIHRSNRRSRPQASPVWSPHQKRYGRNLIPT